MSRQRKSAANSARGPAKKSASRGEQFRVIAGQWRGRRLNFAAGTEVRPTGDRVRETLFNWLAPQIEGMRCLDLFAGAGALGIEALSRGAAQVVFVEKDRRLTQGIEASLELLSCSRGEVHCADAFNWLEQSTKTFDLVFIDPPFAIHAQDKLCTLLSSQCSIAPHGWCYVERDAQQEAPQLPPGWSVWREKQAGQVAFQLLQIGEM